MKTNLELKYQFQICGFLAAIIFLFDCFAKFQPWYYVVKPITYIPFKIHESFADK